MENKKKLRQYIRKFINETIRASEANDDVSSLRTLLDGKRNIAWITSFDDEIKEDLNLMGFGTWKVPSNPYNTYIIFKRGFEKQAKELMDIAEKYNGYLSYQASIEDTIRIGKLLEYDPRDIEYFVKRKMKMKL
jgi:hypothetical protein